MVFFLKRSSTLSALLSKSLHGRLTTVRDKVKSVEVDWLRGLFQSTRIPLPQESQDKVSPLIIVNLKYECYIVLNIKSKDIGTRLAIVIILTGVSQVFTIPQSKLLVSSDVEGIMKALENQNFGISIELFHVVPEVWDIVGELVFLRKDNLVIGGSDESVQRALADEGVVW